ncbi:MAG: glycosyltransferase, partial [Nitrososphaeria archaeon]|nr:glycosyltransferase [Nitrososphaeria archaeon]
PGVAFFSRLRGKNVIFRASDCILSLGIHWMRTSEPVGLLAAMYALVFERLTSRLAHLIIVPSEKTKRLFEEHHGVQEDKLFVSPHGYDEKRYSLADDGIRDSLRSKYSLTSEDFLIVFVGSGDWIPNRIAIKYLGDYLAPFLNTELPRAKIIVVGRKTEEFKNLESRNLQVIGEVEDVVPYLVAADLGIAPMKTTGGMSVKAAEYLMMGLPVIATPEVTETIGRLKGVTETDIEHFHLAVLESARGMTINKSVRKRIRQEAVRNFSWDRIGANLTDFIWKSFNGPE